MLTDTSEFDKAYKKGFLKGDMKMFYLTTDLPRFLPYHYHDFYKLLIHIHGDITYHVEGIDYALRPYDTLLIHPGEIHKPQITGSSTYERIIAYISEPFFTSLEKYDLSLKAFFISAQKNKQHVTRFAHQPQRLIEIIVAIKTCYLENVYGSELLKSIKLQEYLLTLGQMQQHSTNVLSVPTSSNAKIGEIMTYINDHLTDDLSICAIASHLYLHPSSLMHFFKQETGYTVGKYISEKRLFLANQLISSGKSITEACYLSGYNHYSTFYNAYKMRYGVSPKAGK